MANISIKPSLEDIQKILQTSKDLPNPPTLIPLTTSISSEFLTPTSIYLKITQRPNNANSESFLFESAATDERLGRYSFAGTSPRKILRSGPKHSYPYDPLPKLSEELGKHRVANLPELRLPPLTGGAIGYVGYDCVRYFESGKVGREYGHEGEDDGGMKDVLELPESLFMFCDVVVCLDHFFQKVVVVAYLHVPSISQNGAWDGDDVSLETAYEEGKKKIAEMVNLLKKPEIPLPPQGSIQSNQEYTSNIGRKGYEAHVTKLKRHIVQGDIIQAVPSQRIARPTSLHPFNIYRHLRTVNPSPYMFYLDCSSFQIIGASPEVLVKEESGRIITHPIAGTIKRGATVKEDESLAQELRKSVKDRAEHVMLVDLARNDVNRVCDPLSTRVDKLMTVQKFSHVQHLVSEVSGVLRPEKTRFDAFRSIFPAGTVSGAPKVRAMQLIASLEKEKRGIYAGAVGYFGYNTVDPRSGEEKEGAMDTCIALRTMCMKDGTVYLQAGGGIVFDSDEGDEYEETMNKLASSMRTIEQAEVLFEEEMKQDQRAGEGSLGKHVVVNGEPKGPRVGGE